MLTFNVILEHKLQQTEIESRDMLNMKQMEDPKQMPVSMSNNLRISRKISGFENPS
jgi:hypothetical protein